MPFTHRWNRGTTLATPSKPLVVGGSPNQRGVVAAASYEARKFGIHSAMPSVTAIAKCPGLIFVRPRFDVYREISAAIHAIFKRYTNLVEGVALDEAYLDVTENNQNLTLLLFVVQWREKLRTLTSTQLPKGDFSQIYFLSFFQFQPTA